jgi:S-adenosylmethionine/arginine decarboxylase-like enzyme
LCSPPHAGILTRTNGASDIPSPRRVDFHVSLTFSHLSVDFIGALPSQLGDTALISGLLIAGAGAAGFTAVGAPIVRKLPGDVVSVVLLLADCHMSAHTFPSEHLMLLDIRTVSAHDAQKALDVFTRRLTAREVRCEKRSRG